MPAGQLEQALAPVCAYLPLGQLSQWSLPEAPEYVPHEQIKQKASDPVVGEYLPTGQLVQSLSLVPLP
jgi:hypothetical protein